MASKNVSRIDVQTPVSFVPYNWQRTLFHRSLVFLEPFHFEIIQSQFFEDVRSGREYFQNEKALEFFKYFEGKGKSDNKASGVYREKILYLCVSFNQRKTVGSPHFLSGMNIGVPRRKS